MTSSTTTIMRHAGIAGQYAVSVETPEGRVVFYGSAYGNIVVMQTESGMQTFVKDPDRFGPFGMTWVERFLAASAE